MEKFNELPQELLLNIFKFFNKAELIHYSRVNKHFYKISKDKSLQDLPWPLLDYTQPPHAVKTLTDKYNIVRSAMTSNGKIVFVCKEKDEIFNTIDYTSYLYDLAKNECQIFQKLYFSNEMSLFPLANGNIIINGEIWDTSQNCIIKELYLSHVAEELSNGNLVSFIDQSLKIFNLETGHCIATITGVPAIVNNLITLSNGNVISDSGNGFLHVWDVTQNYKRLFSIMNNKSSTAFNSLIELPTGEVLSASHTGDLTLWDIPNRKCLGHFTYPSEYSESINKIVLLPNKKQVACLRRTKIQIWDIETRKFSQNSYEIKDNQITSFHILPNGQILTANDEGLKCWLFPPKLEFTNESNNANINNANLNKLNP